MKDEIITRISSLPAERVRLLGRVAGVDSCELVADTDEIVVGAGLDSDLVVPDPLLSTHAFRLRWEKCHTGVEDACHCVWTLEAFPGARVYVNHGLTRHEKLAPGDVISVGCHEFHFTHADEVVRNRRINQNVGDICARLVAAPTIPPGFLNNTPTRQHRRRSRLVFSWISLAALVVLLCSVFIPPVEMWEEIQPPLEITMVEAVSVSPDAVRTLDQVERENFASATPVMERTDLAKTDPRLVEEVRATPILEPNSPDFISPSPQPSASVELGQLPQPELAMAASAELSLERVPEPLTGTRAASRETRTEVVASSETRFREYRADMNTHSAMPLETRIEPEKPAVPERPPAGDAWRLPSRALAAMSVPGMTIARQQDNPLAGSGPARRLSVAEADRKGPAKANLGALRSPLKPVTNPAVPVAPRQDMLASLPKPSPEALQADRSRTINQLAAYKASPVRFEKFEGISVPVVRLAEQLAEMAVAQAGNPISVDGVVSPEEIAVSWKSGAFRRHAPGNPPPEANPPSYCYVGKTEADGKPYLYISFICKDPEVNKLITNRQSGDAMLSKDDSIEIFLDTNFNRKDYYQIIVNAKGAYWSAYYPRPLYSVPQNPRQPWDASPTIKSTISRDAGQWVCEIMIPFDRLGGVPAKGSRWAVNFCRNYRGQHEDWQLQTWFSVYGDTRNFHKPNLFGVFEW